MTKRIYFIRWGQFRNQYDLAWADTDEDKTLLSRIGFSRTSRKEAERLAREERWRRVFDQAFSGYADNAVYPAGYYSAKVQNGPSDPRNWLDRNRYELKGVIWE